MSDFEKCKRAYDRGWTDAEKLKIWVMSGKITAEEYLGITGQEYIT